MNGIVVLDLPAVVMDMNHVQIVESLWNSSRGSHIVVIRRTAEIAKDIGHVPIGYGPRKVMLLAMVAAAVELLHNPPMPAPFKLHLRGDLGPPPKLTVLPRQEAVWKTTVHGPTNRRRWQDTKASKSFKRSGLRGR